MLFVELIGWCCGVVRKQTLSLLVFGPLEGGSRAGPGQQLLVLRPGHVGHVVAATK